VLTNHGAIRLYMFALVHMFALAHGVAWTRSLLGFARRAVTGVPVRAHSCTQYGTVVGAYLQLLRLQQLGDHG
jgi:hypothetical protein